MIKKSLKYYWRNNKRTKEMWYSGYSSRTFLAFFCVFILLTVSLTVGMPVSANEHITISSSREIQICEFHPIPSSFSSQLYQPSL